MQAGEKERAWPIPKEEMRKVKRNTLIAALICFALAAIAGALLIDSLFGEEPQGLVVNERDGWWTANTNPYQIKKLGAWEQPRLSVQARWRENLQDLELNLHFIYFSRNQSPLTPEVQYLDNDGQWHPLEAHVSGGAVVATITMENIEQWAYRETLMFRAYGIEFYPVRLEHQNLLDLYRLLRERR